MNLENCHGTVWVKKDGSLGMYNLIGTPKHSMHNGEVFLVIIYDYIRYEVLEKEEFLEKYELFKMPPAI